MPVNKDNPNTWVKYKEKDCAQCIGTCCTMPVEVRAEDLINLQVMTIDDLSESKRKLVKRLKKEGVIQSYRESTELFMLTQKANGDCYFLDTKTRLCTVYERRPLVCRRFPQLAGNKLGYCPKILKKNG